MDWSKFVTFVKLNLGIKIENKREQDEWAKFADQADEDIFFEAVQPLVDNYAAALNEGRPATKPLLSQISAVYWRRKKEKTEKAMLDVNGKCEYCGDSGQLYVLWDSAKNKAVNVRHAFFWNKPSFDIRTAACSCPRGRQITPGAPFAWYQNNVFCGFRFEERDRLEELCYLNARGEK